MFCAVTKKPIRKRGAPSFWKVCTLKPPGPPLIMMPGGNWIFREPMAHEGGALAVPALLAGPGGGGQDKTLKICVELIRPRRGVAHYFDDVAEGGMRPNAVEGLIEIQAPQGAPAVDVRVDGADTDGR